METKTETKKVANISAMTDKMLFDLINPVLMAKYPDAIILDELN